MSTKDMAIVSSDREQEAMVKLGTLWLRRRKRKKKKKRESVSSEILCLDLLGGVKVNGRVERHFVK